MYRFWSSIKSARLDILGKEHSMISDSGLTTDAIAALKGTISLLRLEKIAKFIFFECHDAMV